MSFKNRSIFNWIVIFFGLYILYVGASDFFETWVLTAENAGGMILGAICFWSGTIPKKEDKKLDK